VHLKGKNLDKLPEGGEIKIHLKASSEQFYQFESLDKAITSTLSLKVKSCHFPATTKAILDSSSESKPLLYKKRSTDVHVSTVSTPTHINFVFENRAAQKRVFDISF
jgi:hypothetical protein